MKRLTVSCLLGFAALLSVPPALEGEQIRGLETNGFSGQQLGLDVVDRARSYLHVDYRYGGSDAAGMDCSGLVYRVFLEAADLRLPRAVADLYGQGTRVSGALLPGDLVFFNTDGQEPSHVGIYIGGRQVIHAASQGFETGVIVSSLDETYYSRRYLQSRRVLPTAQPEIVVDLSAAGPILRLDQTVPAGYPLKVILRSRGPAAEYLTVRFEREGRPWFSRLVRLQPPFAQLWFTPSPGDWRVVCEDAQQKVVGAFEFTSGRKP